MQRETPDEDFLPVIVPRNEKRLVRVSADRVNRLREHLVGVLRDFHRARPRDQAASPSPPEPAGFPALVLRTACSLCKGVCCKNGGDDAFLDFQVMARLRMADLERDDAAIVNLYLERVPGFAYEGSCIFHSKTGCTLDRSMRANVCNAYLCGGLASYLKSHIEEEPTVVMAGEASTMRVSPVLRPATHRNPSPARKRPRGKESAGINLG